MVTFSFFGGLPALRAGVPLLHTSYASTDAQKLLYSSQAASFMPSGFHCASRIQAVRREISIVCEACMYPSKGRFCKGVRASALENHVATSLRENLQEMKLTHVGLASFKTTTYLKFSVICDNFSVNVVKFQ